MAVGLTRGQRIQLDKIISGNKVILSAQISGIDVDLSIFGLDESKRLSDDRYFVFYNQPNSPEKAITLNQDQSFTIDLQHVPVQIHRLLFAATTDKEIFSKLQSGQIHITDGLGGSAHLELSGNMFSEEQALMLLELYRHQGQWRLMFVGQGFNGGLQALLESLGGEVVDDSQQIQESVNWDTRIEELGTVFGQPAPSKSEIWEPLTTVPRKIGVESGSCYCCGKKSSIFNQINTNGLCKTCKKENDEGLQMFRLRFLNAAADGIMELHEWHDLQNTIINYKLDAEEALGFVRSDALILLERTMAIARADGIISEQEEEVFNRLVSLLLVPETMVQHLRAQIEELRLAAQLREGHLPTIESTLILDSEEIAHLECPATYRHVTATRTRDISGRIIVTNRQVHFVSQDEGGWNIQYSKVLRIEELSDGIKLELGVKKGSGYYHTVSQPLILGATLDALVRINKRLLMMPQTERASRKVPQKVKIEVWQRDQGQCVECTATEYLEFDHVIPHSLGGASTVGNIQLLCRRCNLQKSNRI